MSTIDPTSQSQLDSILKKLGVQKEEDTSRGNKDTLGQSDFSEADDNTATEPGPICTNGKR